MLAFQLHISCCYVAPVTGDLLPVSWIRYRRLIAYFSDPLQETHCLFLGSVTGDYCLFLGSLYPDNFSLITNFRGEGG